MGAVAVLVRRGDVRVRGLDKPTPPPSSEPSCPEYITRRILKQVTGQQKRLAGAIRRMLSRKLSMAWERWQFWYTELMEQKRRLRRAVARHPLHTHTTCIAGVHLNPCRYMKAPAPQACQGVAYMAALDEAAGAFRGRALY